MTIPFLQRALLAIAAHGFPLQKNALHVKRGNPFFGDHRNTVKRKQNKKRRGQLCTTR